MALSLDAVNNMGASGYIKTLLTGWRTAILAQDVVLQADIDTKPDIESGAGAPSSTPTKVGDIYVDTTGQTLYIAADTDDSDGWILCTN